MALPVTIPNEFANATASIPLSQLDTNFNTLANAVNGISDGSESLANVSVTGGTISNVAVSATTLNTSGAVVFNDAGADVDFRVEGDTEPDLLFVDASTDRVGIGTNAPTTNLNIASAGVPNLRFNHTDAGTTDKLGGVQFGGGADVNVAEVAGYYDGATDTGALVFSTEPTGGDLTERMRITSDGYLRMASGTGGIQFGGDTAAANALDDYEEGTWTPAWAFSTSGSAVTTLTLARYTKIGRIVYINVRILTSSISSPTGNVTITGLPFPSADISTNNRFALALAEVYRWLTDMPNISASIQNNTSSITLFKQATNDGSISTVQGSDMSSSANHNALVISGFYEAV